MRVGLQKSITRITNWHHKACRVMTNGDPQGWIFLSHPHMNNGFIFLLTTKYLIFILAKSWKILSSRKSKIIWNANNTRNKLLTQKPLKQGYQYHKLRKTCSKFYRRNYDLISKFRFGLKSFWCQGLSEPEFYGDLVYKLKKIVGSDNFSAQFMKIVSD